VSKSIVVAFELEVTTLYDSSTATRVTVPVKVGLAIGALVAIAEVFVAMSDVLVAISDVLVAMSDVAVSI